jgi:SAM-dependent MidA family methyltransferase
MLLPAMTPLQIVIRDEIRRIGPIPFARFMQLALYCPELGYYDRFPHNIGAQGDFYTSVSVGPLFGRLLAARFAAWFRQSGIDRCRVIECGAHDGRLARDLIEALRQHDPALGNQLEYGILEPSPRRQAWQQDTLGPIASQVRWARDWSDWSDAGLRGVIFANELLDALPVHRLGWDRARRSWFEWGVAIADADADDSNDPFVWIRLAPSNSLRHLPIPDLPDTLRDLLPDGFTIEVCPEAVVWWQRAAATLRQGWLLTFDYGLREEEFFDPGRARGTLRACSKHRLQEDLLGQPGEQDLTAHVNFTAIERAGVQAGLRTECWTSQGRFLGGILADLSHNQQLPDTWSSIDTRQFQTLTHPDHLGTRHQVLVQSRGLSTSTG